MKVMSLYNLVIAESVETLKIEKVYAKGKLLVDNGKSLFQGHYQRDPITIDIIKHHRIMTGITLISY